MKDGPGLLVMLGLALWGCATAAQAQLLLTPSVLNFGERTRVQELTVANRGSVTGVYRVEPVLFGLADDGQLAELPAGVAPHWSAASWLRFSPRQFELAPGETQSVRVVVRPPASAAAGGYRSHLRVRWIGPAATEPTPSLAGTAQAGALQMAIRIEPAWAVPVLVHHKVTPGAARIDGVSIARLPDGTLQWWASWSRHGASASSGLYSLWLRQADGSEHPLARPRGLRIYGDTPSREITAGLPAALTQASRNAAEFCLRYADDLAQATVQQRCVALPPHAP
jgi:hypothetical protein